MEKNLVEKVDEIYNELHSPNKKIRKKKMRIIRKAKVSRSKRKKGWIGIVKIEENGNMSGEKVKIEDFTYKLKKGNYHATNGQEKVWWNGKHPVLFQPTWRLNPLYLGKEIDDKNETYGQKYVMATMKKDLIKVKPKAGGFLIWIVLIIVAIVGYSIFTGGA